MQSCSQLKYMEVKGETSQELEEGEKEHIKSCHSCMTAYLKKIDENRRLKTFLIERFKEIKLLEVKSIE